MNSLLQKKLSKKEKKAIQGLKEQLKKDFSVKEIVLFGSKARGDSDAESDLDVLVVLNDEVDDDIRKKVFSLSFELELKYDVIFGILVEQKDFWDSPRGRSMPIRWNIDKEGIEV